MRRLLKIVFGYFSFLAFSLVFSKPIFAQGCNLTGLGFCNDIGVSDVVSRILSIAIGVAGGVAFLLLIYGGFRMISSQGDPKALQDARGIITSAISGLLFIIFSVFILKLIGVSILGLPI